MFVGKVKRGFLEDMRLQLRRKERGKLGRWEESSKWERVSQEEKATEVEAWRKETACTFEEQKQFDVVGMKGVGS